MTLNEDVEVVFLFVDFVVTLLVPSVLITFMNCRIGNIIYTELVG